MTLVYLGIVAAVCILVTLSVYSKFWDYGLTAEVSFSQNEVEEGQTLIIKEKVENRKMLPLPMLMVKFEMDRNIKCVDYVNTSVTDKQYRNDWVSIMPYKRVTKMIEVIGEKRGFYSIDEMRLVTSDILLHQLHSKPIESYTWLYVYPARSQFMQLPEIFSRMYGEYLVNRQLQEDSMEFKGIRDYVETDPMRKVNWKASARTGNLKVNQYYDSTSQRITVFLNVTQKGILRYYDLIEESIRIARNFIEEFVHKGIPVRIISNCVDKLTGQEIYLREGAGLSHIDACLKQLAKMDIYAPARSMEEIIREQKLRERTALLQGEVSLLISAEQTPELAEAYLNYAGEGGSANWLIPIHESMKSYLTEHVSDKTLRGTSGNYIHTEYLVMEELAR